MRIKKLKIDTHNSIIVEHGKELFIPFTYDGIKNCITIEIREVSNSIIELLKFDCPEGRKIENGHQVMDFIEQLVSQVFEKIMLRINKKNYVIEIDNKTKQEVLFLIRSVILQRIIYQ
jgi:hypothetical protein